MFGRICIIVAIAAAMLAADPYLDSVKKWRQNYESSLRGESGWLSVAGLFWLQPGVNSIELPAGLAESFTLSGREVTHKGMKMSTDKDASPSILQAGRVKLTVIERNGKFAVRMRDPESEMRTHFTGTKWYPVRPDMKIRARFIPHPAKKTLSIPDVTGNTQLMISPGIVEFTVEGQLLRLEPVDDEGQLFFIFKDKTAGKTTYGAGRMLYAPLPKGGYTELDFNLAKNPPCAFTPYATCPLPPKQNILPVAIAAGELAPPEH